MDPHPHTVESPRNAQVSARSAMEVLKQRGEKVMRSFGRLLFSIAGLAGFALLVALLPAQKAAATGGAPVIVKKTPLPVSGAVSATVTGNVNANITNATVPVSGNVNANISNATVPVSGTVNIGSMPTVQVSLASQAQNSFSVQGYFGTVFNTTNFGNSNELNAGLYTVPTGKIAIVESFTGSCRLDQGVLAQAMLSGGGYQAVAPQSPPVNFFGTSTINNFALSGKTYFQSGQTIQLSIVAVDAQDNNSYCQAGISGYLVPAQ